MLITAQLNCFSQEEWTLKKDNSGIKVYARKVIGHKINELKVETILEGRLSQLAAIIAEVNKHEEWVYKTIQSSLLKQNSFVDLFYYTVIAAPWPFDNRDVVIHITMQQNPQTKVLNINANSTDGYVPVKKDIVRVTFSRASWMITPLNNHQLKVEYRILVDPGDGLPAWLINLFSSMGPYDTFIKLRERIKLPQYAQAKYASIID